MFLAGSSAGGWLASNLLELRAQEWAGAMIYVAGRHPTADLLTNKNSTKAFYLTNLKNLRSLDISFTYVDTVEPLLRCKNLQKLDISDTHVEDISPLKSLPELNSLSMWNLWLDRSQVDNLKQNLPNLTVIDYQWDLYEKDSIDRVLPKLRVKLN